MNCQDLLRALNEFVDGNLETPECARFAEHLAGCHPCRIVVDNVRLTIELYKGDTPYPMPDSFRRQMHAALRSSWERRFAKG